MKTITKRILMVLISAVMALCVAVGLTNLTNDSNFNGNYSLGAFKAYAEESQTFSETKYNVSNNKEYVLFATVLKNTEAVYAVGYTFEDYTVGQNDIASTSKYFTSIKMGESTVWTAADIFGGDYSSEDAMIVWEVAYVEGIDYGACAYAKVGQIIDGVLYEKDPEVIEEGIKKDVVVPVETFDITINSNNDEYGSVDVATIVGVEKGTDISVNGNVLTIGDTVITATAKADTVRVDYSFVGFDGVEESVEGNLTITANFTATEIPAVLSLSKTMIDSYELGKTVALASGSIYGENCVITAKDPDGTSVSTADNKLTLEKEGVYTITYTLESDDSVAKEVKIRSVANLPFVSSNDGAVSNSMSGTVIYANNFNKETVLTINKVVDVSGAKFAGNYLISQLRFGDGLTDINGIFGNFVVKVTDYKDPTNYFTITLATPAESKMNAYVKYSKSEITNLAEGANFAGSVNVIFDYAEKKIAIADKDHVASIDGFEGFTDGKCVVTMYGLDWIVPSVNLGFDWVFDSRDYTVNLNDLYTTVSQNPEGNVSAISLSRVMFDSYEQGKTLVLPTANANCVITATDPDGSAASVVDNKLTLAKAGVYTVTYALESDSSITKEIKIRSVANLGYISSSDGAVSTTTDANWIYLNNYNKGSVLTVNKIADVSNASFAGAYVIAQPSFGDGISSINNMFGGFTVKLTDYKNADNYITITIQTPADAKCIASIKVSGSDVVYTAGGENGKSFAGSANIFFDYAEKKISITDRNDFVVVEEFEGFTDGKCIITMYAEDWADGVESANVKVGYITDNRNYTVNLNDFYA